MRTRYFDPDREERKAERQLIHKAKNTMKRYELFDIRWDLPDGHSAAGLPTTPIRVNVEPDDIFDPEYDAAGYLSDNYGYHVLGCNWKEV